MLAHSPPFPLVVFYGDKSHNYVLTPEDEREIMFALEHRDRVRRILLCMPVATLQKVIKAMDDQFPMLESLYISLPTMHNINAHLALPMTFRAPQLNNCMLKHFASIGPPFLTTAVSLHMLSLRLIHPSTNLYPNDLLQALSVLPQLHSLAISFSSPIPNRDIDRHMLRTPNITHTTLPNIRQFNFSGVSAYLEAILSHMNAPLLEKFNVSFFNQLSFSVPHFGHFLAITENLRSSRVNFVFSHKAVTVGMYPSAHTPSPALYIHVGCDHLDWQVSSMAQIFNAIGPSLSAVVDLTLSSQSHTLSSEWHNQADHTQWRELLGSFKNVRTLQVLDGLVGEVSRCLELDGTSASEILPELKTLICPLSLHDKRFARFVHDREVAGLPIHLITHRSGLSDLSYRPSVWGSS